METSCRYLHAIGKSPYITNEMIRPGNAYLNMNLVDAFDDF